MEKLKLVDSTFSHSVLGYCSDFQKSEIFTWDRHDINFNEDIVVYTDTNLVRAINNGKSYGWLIEPICINNSGYSDVLNYKNNFKKIFTHDKGLLDMGEPFKLLPFGCCWIPPEEQMIYDKTKNLSIIASFKRWTEGHNFRHSIIEKYGSLMDVFGNGYNRIEYKLFGLKDYRFQIVVENCKRDYWFTEKLIDCFRTGTIPIYWGCPSINTFFDVNGIIQFDNLNDLEEIIKNCNENLYNSKLESIKNNFKISKQYLLPDNHVFNLVKNDNK